ncbi:SDR family NAD(P)-dependent oxidoreductase [Novosphingobium aquimarinum]|uniref:SDR family NAD(P)-dependent oxidoreductase n=1 Tax=Novosphingobium aquimarinum TaxID=2682494 RepID=UPI0012EB2D63|nr:SDR family NAD(P)-dependent oxidoreductase [Novosphingobium aquimarinum]
MFDFAGKTVLVTGGGAGIGRATVEAFAKAGARVAIIEIDPERAADAEAALGDDALVITGDVTQSEVARDAAKTIEDRFGGLDVLVNNVGDFLNLAAPFEQLSEADIHRLYMTNLGHVFGVTHAMLPLLRNNAPGSSIVSVSSVEGFRGIPNCAVYAACKAGITGFTQSLALELGPVGIRVNLIAPETTDTPQVPVSMMVPEENRKHVSTWLPLGRFGQPKDMASGILFLASEHAAWITGTALHIDGGALAAAGWYRDERGVWTNMPIISGNGLNF